MLISKSISTSKLFINVDLCSLRICII